MDVFSLLLCTNDQIQFCLCEPGNSLETNTKKQQKKIDKDEEIEVIALS